MFVRIVMSLIFLAGLAGCATSRGPSSIQQLQVRVSELEEQVQQKDEELQELKAAVNDLHRETQRVASRSAKEVTLPKDSQQIIKVDAVPQDVQKALQKAGFYAGSIDGKIGSKTKVAIAEFQKANGLKSDGVVGKQTWVKLQEYLGPTQE